MCPEALAGTQVPLRMDGNGQAYCERCGASYAVVEETRRMVQADWNSGGPGYRAPRPGEVWAHPRDTP